MIGRIKIGVGIFFLLIATLLGRKIYFYVTHAEAPLVILKGIEAGGTYKDVCQGSLAAQNPYKIAQLTLTLDGKEVALKNNGRIGRAHFETPFMIDTKVLENGPHALSLEAIDSSYNRNKNSFNCTFFVDNSPLQAALVQSDFKIDQGRTAHIRINAYKNSIKGKVHFLSRSYDVFPQAPNSTMYECFVPVDCEDQAQESPFTVDLSDAALNSLKLSGSIKIRAVEFKKQVGFRVDPLKLEEEKEMSLSSKILDQALEQWTVQSPKEKLWTGPFIAPITIRRIVTPFGEIRTTKEKGRYQHKAVDIIDAPKAVIWAAQSGKIIIKDRYVMSGNTVAIDHGYGIITLYYHLHDFADIAVGEIVKKGNPIGTLGMSGYASGYHLHFALLVQGIAVDPLQWIDKSF